MLNRTYDDKSMHSEYGNPANNAYMNAKFNALNINFIFS